MEKIKQSFEYYTERFYPYILGAVVVLVTKKLDINLLESNGLPNALDAVISMSTLIIGFLGTLIPIIIGLKSESEFVKKILENDENRLFQSYMRSTVLFGIVLILITIVLYFNDSISNEWLRDNIFHIWVGGLIIFSAQTYRSMSFSLQLIFKSGSKVPQNPETIIPEDTESEKEYKMRKK